MKRRNFIALAGVGTALLPFAAFGEDQSKVYRVGLLASGPPIDVSAPRMAPLIRGLATRGYVVGKNLVVESRGAAGHVEKLPQLIDELVAAKIDVLVTFGYPPAVAAKQAGNVPTVAIFAGDPVGTRLVESLSRPGGTITGISDVSVQVTPKRLELLKRMAP
ncbi:MAG TPA: ABC transporter substrate binding protein, partial [Candidatus Cybelea sp.]|nr:ABC transporter substrate binding protein [Candidatus Cybelea sp.]